MMQVPPIGNLGELGSWYAKQQAEKDPRILFVAAAIQGLCSCMNKRETAKETALMAVSIADHALKILGDK
jgi:hypothetical protein